MKERRLRIEKRGEKRDQEKGQCKGKERSMKGINREKDFGEGTGWHDGE
jgi:hypothetical protein